MTAPVPTPIQVPAKDAAADTDVDTAVDTAGVVLVEEDTLVEDVSIDGMCGVY